MNMKISLNNISNYHTELPPVAKAAAKTTNTEKANRNYDAIIIQSDSRQIAEKTFSSSLAQAVSQYYNFRGEDPKSQRPDPKRDVYRGFQPGCFEDAFPVGRRR